MCQVWNVQWSSSATLAKEMAPGEHRYEDSYFLKRDKANGQVEQLQAKRSKNLETSEEESSNGLSTPMVASTPLRSDKITKDAKDTTQKSSKFQCTIH
jgi:hypothetical protein